MIYEQAVLGENGYKSIRKMKVDQDALSSECWMIQIIGIDACTACNYRDTDECGGKNIRITGKNEHGHSIPIGIPITE